MHHFLVCGAVCSSDVSCSFHGTDFEGIGGAFGVGGHCLEVSNTPWLSFGFEDRNEGVNRLVARGPALQADCHVISTFRPLTLKT
jgi:hypothetical protein